MEMVKVAEEVCIVRYGDNACLYETVTSSKHLREAINHFVCGSDYEVQYMGGVLSRNATDYVLELMDISEEYEVNLGLVGCLYNYYLSLEDITKVLEEGNYMEISGSNKLDAFIGFVDDMGTLEAIPQDLRFYFDYEKYMQDLQIEGLEIVDLESTDGKGNYDYLFIY